MQANRLRSKQLKSSNPTRDARILASEHRPFEICAQGYKASCKPERLKRLVMPEFLHLGDERLNFGRNNTRILVSVAQQSQWEEERGKVESNARTLVSA